MHRVAFELCDLTGLPAPEDRSESSMAAFRKNLMMAVNELSDEDFNLLTDEAAKWMDAAVEAWNGDSELPDFTIVDGEDENEDEGREVEGEVETADERREDEGHSDGDAVEAEEIVVEESNDGDGIEVTAPETESEADLEAEKEKKTATSSVNVKSRLLRPKTSAVARKLGVGRNKTPAGFRVKEMLLQHGLDLDSTTIVRGLIEDDLRMSPATIQSIRYEFKQTLQLLNSKGLLKKGALIPGGLTGGAEKVK